MKTIGHFVALAAASFVFAGTATASDTPKDKSSSGGSSGSSGSSGGASTGNAVGNSSEQNTGILDTRGNKLTPKRWEVAAGFETHGLFIQNDLNNRRKLFNYGFVSARFDITKNDRISARWGFAEYFIANAGESGLRGSDISLTYSHLFKLPWELDLRAALSVTAPIGYYSQCAGSITSPTGSLQLDRAFGGVSVDLRAFGGGDIVRYTTSSCAQFSSGGATDASANGSGANSRGSLGFFVNVEYKVWFHHALSLGVDAYDAYFWLYNVAGAIASNDPSYPNPQNNALARQPQQVLQAYGGEIYARYLFPAFYGVRIDATVAVANGDPTLGYNSVLHDGIAHVGDVVNWRQNLGMYGAVSVRY